MNLRALEWWTGASVTMAAMRNRVTVLEIESQNRFVYDEIMTYRVSGTKCRFA
jgi:hypothetical protein